MIPEETLKPFRWTQGKRTAKVVVVGEAWGEQEDLTGIPFIGSSGQELNNMLRDAGLKREDCLLTNVFPFRPQSNDIYSLCGPKAAVGAKYPFPQLAQGKYILWEHLPHVERLQAELREVRPNLVIALGNTACWAVLGMAKIGTIRGTIAESILVDGLKVLPTYHPSAVLRNWALRPIVIADLLKAAKESKFPEINRPRREILISPTIEEIWEWTTRPAWQYACDVETRNKQITVIGFARHRSDAIVIPFWNIGDPLQPNYWKTLEEELEARRAVNFMLSSAVPKLFQNGMYDIQYCWREGYQLRNCQEDTMLLHHALYPEMQKGLGFLGSIYTNEPSWKLMNRPSSTAKDIKRDN